MLVFVCLLLGSEWEPGLRMLYIFRVDTGSMMTLEMSLALETVAHLRYKLTGVFVHSSENITTAEGFGAFGPYY